MQVRVVMGTASMPGLRISSTPLLPPSRLTREAATDLRVSRNRADPSVLQCNTNLILQTALEGTIDFWKHYLLESRHVGTLVQSWASLIAVTTLVVRIVVISIMVIIAIIVSIKSSPSCLGELAWWVRLQQGHVFARGTYWVAVKELIISHHNG